MESVIRKWGNSPALRLPTAALKAAGYSLRQKVAITVTPGPIVIEPSHKVQYNLADLLDGITRGNPFEVLVSIEGVESAILSDQLKSLLQLA